MKKISRYIIGVLQVDLWFGGYLKPTTPMEPTEAYPYDRLHNLKISFFDVFADHSTDPPQLDYVDLVCLLYFY